MTVMIQQKINSELIHSVTAWMTALIQPRSFVVSDYKKNVANFQHADCCSDKQSVNYTLSNRNEAIKTRL